MNLLVTGCCGHIGSYLVNNINKIKKIKKTFIIDNLNSTQVNSLFKTTYGSEFDSGIVDQNIYGVQFHPEKSHKFGMNLFKKFANL